MGEKLRVVFLPLLLVTLALAAVFSLLNWLLVIRTGWLPLDEDVVALWLPAAAALAAVGLVIAPRLHILWFGEKTNLSGLYILVAILIVAGPTILAQKYLQASFGEMVQVQNAASIPLNPRARFFTIEAPCVNKSGARPHTRVSVGGDNGEDLNVELTAAVPFCDAPVWLGFLWGETIDNRLDDSHKDALYRAFLKRSQAAVDNFDTRSVRFYERIGYNSQRRALLKALKEGKIADTAPIFLKPHTEPFAALGGAWLAGAVMALAGGMILWLLMLLPPRVVPPADRKPAAPGALAALVVPHRESFGLPILIDINLLVYFAMVVSGLGFFDFEIDDLIAWGASSGDLDHGVGLLRLVTATFVHAGFFHILGNMYGLLIGGALLTPVARNVRLLLTYLVSGVGGSLLSVTIHPDYVVVGASGAIFGFFGALIALVGLRDPKILAIRKAILLNVGIFVVLNLIYGFSTPGVDNFAHIGGFLTGLVCGSVLFLLDRREARGAVVQPVPDSSPPSGH